MVINKNKGSNSFQFTISVVMATYNGSKFVKEQLLSVLNQTFPPDEIIIVDDCSNDDTVDIIRSILECSSIEYKLIIHDKNMGVSKSFQDGILEAQYEYIMICDQDDVWLPNKIEITKKYLSKKTSLVVCNASLVDCKLKSLGMSMFEFIRFPLKFTKTEISLSSKEMMNLCLKRNYVTGMCMAGKKNVIKTAFPIPDTMTYDAWLAWILSMKGNTVFIKDELVLYRQHEKNVIGTTRKKENLRKYFSHRIIDKKSYLKKYESLSTVKNLDEEIKVYLSDAVSFYQERIKLGQVKRKDGLIFIWNSLKKGRYSNYTGNDKKEIIKDLFENFFFRV